MARFGLGAWRENMPFWALIALLIVVCITGGGSRADTQSLIILRPLAVIFCGLGILLVNRRQVSQYRFLFITASAITILIGAHLVPLPPAIWSALPGRAIVVEIDKAADIGSVWRPISLTPTATWNALYSLSVPLAALLFGVQLTREQRFRLLYVLLGLGAFTGFLGFVQAIGGSSGPLNFHRVTMPGTAVGVFANRNHQAIFLATLFPALAVYASTGVRSLDVAKRRGWTAVAAGTILIPLILVTGSRGGVLMALVALVLAGLLYRRPTISSPAKRRVRKLSPIVALCSFAVVCLGALTFLTSRAEALRRLVAPDQMEDLRFQIWGPIINMAWQYFPVGSGIGSFVEVFQIGEPDSLLSPTYMNHAHNDWLEAVLTGGAPGILLLLLCVVAFLRVALASIRAPAGEGRSVPFARLGASVIVLLALGSFVDYPLRTPFLMCIFVMAAVWLVGEDEAAAKNTGGN